MYRIDSIDNLALTQTGKEKKVCITDIMTITGFMNNQEKLNHLVYYAKLTSDVKAIEYVQKKNINNQTGKEKKS